MATVAHRLGLADHGLKITLEEFEDAEFEGGIRYELARGALEVTQIPGEPHAMLVYFFYGAFATYDREHPRIIHRYGGASEYRLWLPAMASARHPDLAVSLRNTPKDERGIRIPALAIEVVSEGAEAHHRDYVTKREEYLAYGLREYWIVDRFARKVTVLIRRGDSWGERVFADGQAAEGLVLPGFAVPVADLWAALTDDEAGDEGPAA